MIAKIVPAVRLPVKAGESFDYQIPSSLAPAIDRGSVVMIPFAGRKIAGLVVSVSENSSHGKPLKEILGLANGLSPLPAYTIELWTALAKRFATTLPRFVWTALPTIPARAIQTSSTPANIVIPAKAGIQKKVVDPVFQRDDEHNFVFINSVSDTLNAIKDAVAKASGRQVLILVPTVDEAVAWSRTVGNARVHHSSLATGAKYDLACSAANGTAKIVIGTKSAVFLPFSDLAQIVILNAGSSSHLQEDSDPRFDDRVIAVELAKATGAKLIALDALPPLGMTPEAPNGSWRFDNDPRAFDPVIHDLHDAAKAAKGRVLVSDRLETAIDETVADGGRVLVLLNRRGVSTAYICKACGTIVNCPDCAIPLTVHHDRMSCFACEHLYPLPDNCLKCGATDLKTVGSGSKTLHDALAKRHPLAKIVHVDRDSWEQNINNAQIVVGTTAVFGSLPPDSKPFDLVADALMGAGQAKSGIWSTENSARVLRTLGSLLAANGTIHVQTFDPDSPALKALKDPLGFIKKEHEERVAFGYPPAKTLITIYGSGAKEEPLWKEAVDLSATLRSHMPLAMCQEPVWSRPKLFRGKYRLTVAIKLPHGQDHGDLVQYLPAGFSAEVREL